MKYFPTIRSSPPITIRDFRGVSTFDPFSIAENFFTDMSNLVTDDYPAISTRPGHTALGSAVGSKVLGIGVWKDTELHAVFDDGTWRKWTGSTWTTLKSGLDTAAEWTFTNFKGSFTDINLVGCNGVDGLHRYDGSTVQTFGDADASINYVTTYQNRLWGAWGRELHASALDQPAQWQLFNGNDEDSYYRVVEDPDGGNINMLSGGLRKLVIGFPGSVWELYGGVPSDFTTQRKTSDTGFISNRGAITQDGVMRFIHEQGIYEFGGGLVPDHSFSDIVKGYLTGIGTNAVAGTDGQKMYFYINGKILVYDPRYSTWCVWEDITPTCFAVMDDELYIGDDQGRVLKLGGDDDAGTAINWHATTKPFNNASLAQKLRIHRMWIVVDLEAGSTLKVYLSPSAEGDSDWVEVTANIQGNRVIIPVSKMANEEYIRIKLEGTGQATIREITRQQRTLPLK